MPGQPPFEIPMGITPNPLSMANQVHRALVAKEEARCLEREKETGKPVRRRRIAVPLVRIGPKALCQRTEFLLMVTDYDYDLSNEAFQAYCTGRGTSCLAEPGSRRWDFFADHRLAKEDYLADPYFRSAAEHEGSRHTHSDDEMSSGWRVIQFGRAVLQDSWELFCAERESSASPSNEKLERRTRSVDKTPSLFDE
jgi:hypothetical protein